MNKLFCLLSLSLLAAASVSAHEGRLADDGCHTETATGDRHCHPQSPSTEAEQLQVDVLSPKDELAEYLLPAAGPYSVYQLECIVPQMHGADPCEAEEED